MDNITTGLTSPALLLALDLTGVFVFAISGALAAVRTGLDLFGVLVLAVATALGGGLIRDVLIGLPPAAFQDWRYLTVPVVAGLLTFVGHRQLQRLWRPIRVFDAAGLSLFVVSGTLVALGAGLGPLPAIGMGVLTGIGGGMLRDVLVREIPIVLRREVYAVPAVIGASVIVVADALGQRGAVVAVSAAVLVFTIRMVALAGDWHFPRAVGTGSGDAPGRRPPYS